MWQTTKLISPANWAWTLAREHIQVAQVRQKRQYDKCAKDHNYKVGDRVIIFLPSVVTGKARKLARPYYGPYRVLSVKPTNIEARLVDKPDTDSIFVTVSRVWPCYPELSDASWTGPRKDRMRRRQADKAAEESNASQPVRTVGPVTRSMIWDTHGTV